MTNTELKHLVDLYWQTREELNNLRKDYKDSNIDREVLGKVEELLKQKSKDKPTDLENRQFLYTIYDKFLHPEIDQVNDKNRSSEIEINKFEVKLQIAYAEMKLEVIKQLLGEDIIKQIEKYEKEFILKHGI